VTAQVTVTAHFAESWAASRQRIFSFFFKKKVCRESALSREFFSFFTKLFAESCGAVLGKESFFFLKKLALPRARHGFRQSLNSLSRV